MKRGDFQSNRQTVGPTDLKCLLSFIYQHFYPDSHIQLEMSAVDVVSFEIFQPLSYAFIEDSTQQMHQQFLLFLSQIIYSMEQNPL